MTVREFIEDCRKRLLPLYGKEEAASLASRALEDIYNISRTRQITYPDTEIGDAGKYISRLENGEPVQYISGFEYFCGSKFKVGPGVLIPRPETEELVTLAVSEITRSVSPGSSPEAQRAFKIFDVCTGSGCIAWSLHKALAKFFAEKGKVLETYGCDISETALEYAKGQRITLDRRWPMFFLYDVLCGDFPALKSFIGKVDVMISNPPYIAEKEKENMHRNVLGFEPEQALFVPDAHPILFYEKIAGMAAELLYSGGRLYFEINPLFAKDVEIMLKEKGFSSLRILSDMFGRQRFACASV